MSFVVLSEVVTRSLPCHAPKVWTMSFTETKNKNQWADLVNVLRVY